MGAHETDWKTLLVEAGPDLLQGGLTTIVLAAVAIFAGTLLGAPLGAFAASRSRAGRTVAAVVRTPLNLLGLMPALVLMAGLHHGLPAVSAWLHRLLAYVEEAAAPHLGSTEAALLHEIAQHPFASASIALTTLLAASIADIIRRGANHVPAHEVDVARSLGLGPIARLRRVMVPETIRASAIELGHAYLTTIRNTTLAAVIGCHELLHVAWSRVETGDAASPVFAVVGLLFLAVLVPGALVLRQVARSRWQQR